MQLVKIYPNAVERALTIVSVDTTDDSDTVIVNTVEDGQVMICRHDSLQQWQQLQTLGLVPA